MTFLSRLLFGIGLACCVFASALAVEYTVLRLSMWNPDPAEVRPLMASSGKPPHIAEPR